mmetsp:Transcript_55898/g.113991  ORF Transcript_55898/g.113991 Transcript_55898/m.113991 type:complete len:535 (+) Transcript_55898:71-1675(+)
MAAAPLIVTTQSSLVVGDTLAKKETLGNKDTDDNNPNENKQQQGHPSTEKSIELVENTKKPPRMSSVDDYTMLPEGYVPKDEDVICSWARQNHSHPGNEKFRIMINDYAPTYLNVSTKYQKSEVIAKIVAEVRSKSPGGGFIKKDFYSNRWFEVGDEKARDKVGHAIRKAAVGLGKKLQGVKRQPQSALAKRGLKNKGEFDDMNVLNMNVNTGDFFNKAALMNGMNLDKGFTGLSNDMGISPLNMNMNMGALNNLSVRNQLVGVPSMRNTSGLMNAMGMNGVGIGMGMNSMSYSRELEEMLVMNRLRSEVNSNPDTSLLGSIYNNGKSSNDSAGMSGLNMMAGMDDSAMIEEFQRRKLRLNAAAKKEEAMNMLWESDQMSRWANQNKNNNKSPLNDHSMDFNANASSLNGISGVGLGSNRSNSTMGLMGMSALGGAQGNMDNINSNNLDSISTTSFLSKLASGNAKMSDQLFMRGASNFGNNNGMTNSLMNLNNNIGSANDVIGDTANQLSHLGNGVGSQSLNQYHDQFNYDMP